MEIRSFGDSLSQWAGGSVVRWFRRSGGEDDARHETIASRAGRSVSSQGYLNLKLATGLTLPSLKLTYIARHLFLYVVGVFQLNWKRPSPS